MDEVESRRTNTSNGYDVGDILGFGGNSRRQELVGSVVVHKESYFYKMDHPKRGIAVIFNHEKFIVPRMRDRSGTQADCDNLKDCWQRIGFEVTVHQDLGTKALMDELKTLSEIDYSQMDCLVICVLSHGEEGLIFAYDSAYKQDMLWENFTADKCISLAGKPKLFFVQACQGQRLDPGINLQVQVDGNASSYRIPIHADFLFAYSTIPGFVSWRNTKRHWISSLCNLLRENVYELHFLTLLTLVSYEVALNFETYDKCDEEMCGYKLMPCFNSTLTRILLFTKTKHKVNST